MQVCTTYRSPLVLNSCQMSTPGFSLGHHGNKQQDANIMQTCLY